MRRCRKRFLRRSKDGATTLNRGLLLDTHVALWWLDDDRRLGKALRASIAGSDFVFVSAVSAWEVELKRASGKLTLGRAFVPAVIESGFTELQLTFEHTAALADIPQNHTDPFDRMLAAQCRVERLALVTHDRAFAQYDVPVVWA